MFEVVTKFVRVLRNISDSSQRKEQDKLIQTQKHGSLLEKLQVLVKSMIFRGFYKMRFFLQLLAEKLQLFAENLQRFEQTTMFLRSDQLCSKKLQKVSHFVKNHEKSKTNRFKDIKSTFYCVY